MRIVDLLLVGHGKTDESAKNALYVDRQPRTALIMIKTRFKTYKVPVQDTSDHITVYHPLVAVDQRCESLFRIVVGFELGATSLNFEVQDIVSANSLLIPGGFE